MTASEPLILGMSASHNGAVCVLRGREIVVAIQEERLTREKRARVYGSRSSLAVPYCLRAAGIAPEALAGTAISVQGYASAPEQQLVANPDLAGYAGPPPLRVAHHRAHAVSAFSMSGFADAAVLVVDGLGSPWRDLDAGERAVCRKADPSGWETISIYGADGDAIVPLEKHLAPDRRWLQRRPKRMPRFGSLGGMYSAVAVQLFGDALEAGKVMGLAPYGRATAPVDTFLRFDGDDLVFSDATADRFVLGKRWPERERAYRDLAASVQSALEHALLGLARRARALTGSRNLCFAGGVALNSVANERLIREVGFEHVYIPAAAEDSGVAIGAAYECLRAVTSTYRARRVRHDAVGAPYTAADVSAAVRATPAIREVVAGPDAVGAAAKRLARGDLGGWFVGRSELGPRSLGQRSILADPRLANGKEVLNRRVKHREAFRPFAPAILEEHAADWFELGPTAESPFMLRVVPFHEHVRARVPAVVHVDGTGRLQTVARDVPELHALISAFHAQTGVPMLLNTSFNVMGEPIVETPEDALWCFLATGLDFVVVEHRLFVKKPGYESPLDLVPVLAARRAIVELPVTGAKLQLDAPDGEIGFVVVTPWGETTVRVPAEQLAVISQIDGKRTGHDIQRSLARSGVTPERVLAVLCALRRSRVIAFRGFRPRRGGDKRGRR
ncbi:MAG TPA: carbamoyltransferase C-terminal domain-containing protein [Kofleriaceae bacterium]